MKPATPTPPVDHAGLIALAERVEKASGADLDLDAEIMRAVGWKERPMNWRMEVEWEGPDGRLRQMPRPTDSLDAAMTLVPEGWAYGEGRGTDRSDTEGWAWVSPTDEGEIATAATPALALAAAALRARASEISHG